MEFGSVSSNSLQQKYLYNPVSPHGLAVFRICFGILMLWEMIYLIRIDFANIFLYLPQVQFTYPGLGFLKPLPKPMMQILIFLLTLCCIAIITGRYYRWAMAFFALGFSYIFFLDKAYYNNHLYLLCLLSYWLIFIRADNVLIVGKRSTSASHEKVPVWMYNILKAQIFIVYFYGGIAKLNEDWLLRQQPVRSFLANGSFFVDWLGMDIAAYFITYGGVIFDLAIGFLLLYKPTRKLGIAGVLFFNISNANIFDDINIFPYFMICTTVLFLDPEKIRSFSHRLLPKPQSSASVKRTKAKKQKEKQAATINRIPPSPYLKGIIGTYLAFQLLFPLRHLLIEGPVDWTGEAQRFSWRMKIQHRRAEKLEFKVLDYQTKTIYPTNLDAYNINRDQRAGLTTHPEMAWQFAQFLKRHAIQKLNSGQIGVTVDLSIRFNGRSPQTFIDPTVDLAGVDYSLFRHNEWIMPLEDGRK